MRGVILGKVSRVCIMVKERAVAPETGHGGDGERKKP